MMLNSIGLVLLLQSVILVNGLFEGCGSDYNINSSRDINLLSPNYPNKYKPGTSCKYTFTAPTGYGVVLTCTIKIYKDSSQCTTDQVLVSTDNDAQLRGANSYCGSGTFTKESEYQQIALALISNSNSVNGGTFNCTVSVKPQACDCGWSQRGRIVGGTAANPTEYPAMVAIGVKSSSQIFCGGTIINSRTILTATHCTKTDNNPNNLFILTGYTYLSSTSDSAYSKTYLISRIIEHPYYNPTTDVNDIALLITTMDINFSRGCGPVCLSSDVSINLDYRKVDICGWGTTSFGGSTSKSLLKATLSVITYQVCQQYYNQVENSQICTYGDGKDACQLDSGGPVFFKAPDRMFQVGIIIGGNGCGGSYPGMNTRIASHMNWIRSNVVGPLCVKSLS
ncbi:venom serine protease-like [Episyrphus balteatus]|uniref:venom serine protease-like n=1 Tax=Episyrphus balteatus TaxID=286459 RepID=UPI002485723A|nr:venom serine protease-like [Episyrphus balteatus]